MQELMNFSSQSTSPQVCGCSYFPGPQGARLQWKSSPAIQQVPLEVATKFKARMTTKCPSYDPGHNGSTGITNDPEHTLKMSTFLSPYSGWEDGSVSKALPLKQEDMSSDPKHPHTMSYDHSTEGIGR